MSKNRHFQLKSTLQIYQNVKFSLMKLRKRVQQSFFVLHTFRTDSSKYCKNFVFLLLLFKILELFLDTVKPYKPQNPQK